jgi:hypothetical protein
MSLNCAAMPRVLDFVPIRDGTHSAIGFKVEEAVS